MTITYQNHELSQGAQEAIAWLFSSHDDELTVEQCRHAIILNWGEEVAEELRTKFSPKV